MRASHHWRQSGVMRGPQRGHRKTRAACLLIRGARGAGFCLPGFQSAGMSVNVQPLISCSAKRAPSLVSLQSLLGAPTRLASLLYRDDAQPARTSLAKKIEAVVWCTPQVLTKSLARQALSGSVSIFRSMAAWAELKVVAGI